MVGEVSRNASTFGVTSFTYSQSLVDEINALLACNDNDIVKVFEILWGEGTISKSQPDCYLRLIQRCQQKTQIAPAS